jgi:hypothetical protein
LDPVSASDPIDLVGTAIGGGRSTSERSVTVTAMKEGHDTLPAARIELAAE